MSTIVFDDSIKSTSKRHTSMPTKAYIQTPTTAASPTPKELKALKKEVPPGFILEVAWLTASLFFVKIAVPGAF
jgi:hypothetical protein